MYFESFYYELLKNKRDENLNNFFKLLSNYFCFSFKLILGLLISQYSDKDVQNDKNKYALKRPYLHIQTL